MPCENTISHRERKKSEYNWRAPWYFHKLLLHLEILLCWMQCRSSYNFIRDFVHGMFSKQLLTCHLGFNQIFFQKKIFWNTCAWQEYCLQHLFKKYLNDGICLESCIWTYPWKYQPRLYVFSVWLWHLILESWEMFFLCVQCLQLTCSWHRDVSVSKEQTTQ